ncbi:cadmium-induced protein AS8-like isoform X2 [Camellia sinensis]|uniref:cadmium-induced protein AS8-like isoform X2 n=1 Tax=Camellia sinensis TaxID=4442 RepID=UPI00103592A2|nr:cadmium-induced protein AS8-like isoform X2 [Camellia sinensis]XP_028121077.1 cadmium-induced protein AS8-like isoform X2 [Camellia sinensis]
MSDPLRFLYSIYPFPASLAPLTLKNEKNIERSSDLNLSLMVLMIIKGLFRRYERWNPVHPTSGAFWGMGIGIGCGVGWGPGFGPEVIGYVGAGCGVGFSVGITLAGFGIGLPANYVLEVPYNAFMATRSGALEFARSSALLSVGNGWSNISPHFSGLQRKALRRFSSFKHKDLYDKVVNFSDMKSVMSSHTSSIVDHLQKFGARFHPHKGLKD